MLPDWRAVGQPVLDCTPKGLIVDPRHRAVTIHRGGHMIAIDPALWYAAKQQSCPGLASTPLEAAVGWRKRSAGAFADDLTRYGDRGPAGIIDVLLAAKPAECRLGCKAYREGACL